MGRFLTLEEELRLQAQGEREHVRQLMKERKLQETEARIMAEKYELDSRMAQEAQKRYLRESEAEDKRLLRMRDTEEKKELARRRHWDRWDRLGQAPASPREQTGSIPSFASGGVSRQDIIVQETQRLLAKSDKEYRIQQERDKLQRDRDIRRICIEEARAKQEAELLKVRARLEEKRREELQKRQSALEQRELQALRRSQERHQREREEQSHQVEAEKSKERDAAKLHKDLEEARLRAIRVHAEKDKLRAEAREQYLRKQVILRQQEVLAQAAIEQRNLKRLQELEKRAQEVQVRKLLDFERRQTKDKHVNLQPPLRMTMSPRSSSARSVQSEPRSPIERIAQANVSRIEAVPPVVEVETTLPIVEVEAALPVVAALPTINTEAASAVGEVESASPCQVEAVNEEEFENHARKLFDAIDKNNDGQISKTELKHAMSRKDGQWIKQALGVNTFRDCSVLVNLADVDHGGRLDFTEFKNYLKTLESKTSADAKALSSHS